MLFVGNFPYLFLFRANISVNTSTTKKSPLFTIFLTVFIDMLGVGIIIPILAPLLLDPGDMLIGWKKVIETWYMAT